MVYLDDQLIGVVFDIIAEFYSAKEEIPDYRNEPGLPKLISVLQGARQDYYPTLTDKAAYLMVQINKGHFFSNGNKRLALACATVFLVMNGKHFEDTFTRDPYRKLFAELFPTFTEIEDYPDFLPKEFGLYNLSILIADSHKYVDSFDELKTGVCKFLDGMIVPFP
jgi:prophage maintenance system killer protein